jgi:hypothetical protein
VSVGAEEVALRHNTPIQPSEQSALRYTRLDLREAGVNCKNGCAAVLAHCWPVCVYSAHVMH